MSIDKIKTGDDLTQSLDIVSDNISKLKELFPEVLTEGKIDFKVLQDILGNEIEEEEEFYRFTWAGKSQSRREAHKPSTGTLRPCKVESVDWDTTQNLYIEGDNLEVLKLLQKSYSNKVKMIYIDPPYNTGKDFVYKDNYKDNLKNYQKVTGQVDEEGHKLSTNTESDGRYHSNWLNMIYPRLRLSRNLLNEDGVIFMSIDDNEVDNLRKVCDEIFGEENYVTTFCWQKGKEGGNDSSSMRSHYESILLYCKNSKSKNIINLDEKDTSRHISTEPEKNLVEGIVEVENNGELFQLINLSKQKDYSVKIPLVTGEIIEYPSYAPQTTIDRWIKIGKVFVGSKKVPYIKSFLKEELQGQKPSNILTQEIGTTKAGSIEIRDYFGNREIFSYPKPSKLIKRLLEIGMNGDGLFCDFFSGSSSSGDALFQINSSDNGTRKFIQVQLPELTDVKSESYKSGFKTIAEIGKERIRRAGLKIRKENPLISENLDLGFKVFKLDSSNIKGWDGLPDNLEKSLFDSQDNIKSDRKEEDVLFEILLKYGLDLTLPIEEKIIEGKKVFNVGFGALFICLGNELTSKVAEGIGQWKETLKPETCRVIFKDGGFTDVEKTNSVQTLKRFGIQEIKSI